MTDIEHDLKMAMRELEERDAAPYDGVLGRPPAWLPQALLDEFAVTRNRLLQTHTAEDVRNWMGSFREALNVDGSGWIGWWPPELQRDLGALVYVQYVAELGEKSGIQAYLGRGQYHGLRKKVVSDLSSASAKKKLGTKKPITRIIERLYHNGHKTRPQIVAALEGDDALDAAQIRNDPINFEHHETTGDRVYYAVDGNEGEISFKRIDNLLSEIRKKI